MVVLRDATVIETATSVRVLFEPIPVYAASEYASVTFLRLITCENSFTA